MSIVPSGPPRKRGSQIHARLKKQDLYTKSERKHKAPKTDLVYKKRKLFTGYELPTTQKGELIRSLQQIEDELEENLVEQRRMVYQLLNKPSNMLKCIMRVHIYNTHARGDEITWWDLRIQGKIVHPDLQKMYTGRTERAYIRAFSSFFRAIRVVHENGEMLGEWKKMPGQRETEGLGIKKPATQDMTVKIQLFLDHNPQQYKLSETLALFVGSRQETRENVMTLIWNYIVQNKLQDTEESRYINNDDVLFKIFQQERTDIGSILRRLMELHLSDPDPIEIVHRIRLGGEWIETEHIYNIAVEIEDPFQLEVTKYISEEKSSLYSKSSFIYNIRNPSDLERGETTEDPISKNLKDFNIQYEKLYSSLNVHLKRKAFFEEFVENPHGAIESLRQKQNDNAEQFYRRSKHDEIFYDPEVGENTSSFYQQYWVKDLVSKYLEDVKDS